MFLINDQPAYLNENTAAANLLRRFYLLESVYAIRAYFLANIF